MNWKVRSVLVVAAALSIYGLVAYMISSEPGPSNAELERRVQALEQRAGAESNDASRPNPRRGPTGDLYTTLQSNLQTGRQLLMGWDQAKLVDHLGWPDLLQSQRWGYEPRTSEAQYLQVLWGEDGLISGILWSPPDPAKE